MKVDNNQYVNIDEPIELPLNRWWHYFAYLAALFLIIYISNIEVAFASTTENANAWTEKSNAAKWLSTEPVDSQAEIKAFAIEAENAPVVVEKEPHFETVIFTISAYYSPLQGQSRYVTGSYAGDIRLNGSGVNGADGTPVSPGMIAAPPNYQFGTKMYIPGIGTVAVHDRGGAIKGNRLDVWMGYGDKGLQRALSWGKRTLEVKVYGVNPDIEERVELEGYDESEKHIVIDTDSGVDSGSPVQQKKEVVKKVSNKLFSRQLTLGTTGNDVAELQKLLKELDYYEGEITTVFDNDTHKAVTEFQLSKSIIDTEKSYGAGYVGPKTSSMLASVVGQTAHARSNQITTEGSFVYDLKPGDSGEDVRKLQEELGKVNLFGLEPTGYYGEVTEHAVYKFQQINKLAGDKSSSGAGVFGPLTRSRMNEIVAARLKMGELLALKD